MARVKRSEKTTSITFRLKPSLKAQLEKLAVDFHRSTSQQIEFMLTEALPTHVYVETRQSPQKPTYVYVKSDKVKKEKSS